MTIMIKKILLLFVFCSSLLEAQHTVTGEMQPPGNFEWIVLYQLKGAKQDYIANTSIENGKFSFTIPKERPAGIYRMIYNLENQLFVDFIYDHEDISLVFDPKSPNQRIQFTQSKNNQIYQAYLRAIAVPQQQLDSLQVAYFKNPSAKKIEVTYAATKKQLDKIQRQYEEKSEGLLVSHFIKSSARYNAALPIKMPAVYLKSVKTHFFDHLDFNNSVLLNSTFISDRINDYIFYLNNSDDPSTLNKLWEEAIDDVLAKIKSNQALSRDIQEGLLYNFAQQQNVPLASHVLNHYIQLPKELQDPSFVNDIKGQLRTAVGNIAPNILWKENNTEKSLHKLYGSPYYLVVFWSSTCSHCLRELPILKEYLKDKNNIDVIAVGLENEESKKNWESQIKNYPKWTHIYGKNKWENRFAREYGVNATPSFYVLDGQKKILAKPDGVQELKVFFKEK